MDAYTSTHCNRNGLLTKVCGLNSEHKETHVLPKLSTENGYTYSVTKEATCIEIGKAKFIYTIDEKTFEFEVDLPKTEHKHTEVRGAKTATCNEERYTGDVYCKDCGTLLEKGRAIEKPKHHDFENGVCKICGTPDGSIDNDEIKVTVNVETDGNELVYVIDLTSKKNPTEILANLKTVFENAAHDNASIKVIFGKVTIFFNKNATKLINNTSEIPLSIIKVTDKSETSGDYAKAGFDLNNSQIYKISLGKATFEGEEVTVSIQYGTDGKEIKVYYVDKDGNKTEVQSTYDKESGTVTFTTTHFSTYIIYDAQNANAGEYEDTPKDDTNNLFILVTAISITVLIASAGAVTFYFTTKSKKQEK